MPLRAAMPYLRCSPACGLLVLTTALLLAGCAPRLLPLYHDYAVAEAEHPIAPRITTALEEAGWEVVATDTPNLIATRERTMSRWGLYDVRVMLEVAEAGSDHVRVFVHPYRYYITGGRSKIPFLKGRLRAQILPEVTEALKRQGFRVVGTPPERDRVAATQ